MSQKPLSKETLARLEAMLTDLLNQAGAKFLTAEQGNSHIGANMHYGKMLGYVAVGIELKFEIAERLMDRLRDFEEQHKASAAKAGAA